VDRRAEPRQDAENGTRRVAPREICPTRSRPLERGQRGEALVRRTAVATSYAGPGAFGAACARGGVLWPLRLWKESERGSQLTQVGFAAASSGPGALPPMARRSSTARCLGRGPAPLLDGGRIDRHTHTRSPAGEAPGRSRQRASSLRAQPALLTLFFQPGTREGWAEGASVRDLLDNVQAADWSPDGTQPPSRATSTEESRAGVLRSARKIYESETRLSDVRDFPTEPGSPSNG
jgi:hypothetical protein